MANEVRTTRSMAKRKHDDSGSDLQQPDATTTDRSQSMQPSATASSSFLKNHTSTSVAPSQILEPSQSSGAADAAPQQPQAIMNQAYNGPTKRKKVINHKAATLSALNAEISLMKSKVSTLEAQNVAIKADNAELEAEIAELEARNDKFKSEYIHLEALENSPRHRNAYLEAQNDKLKTQNTKLQAQCDKLQRDKLKDTKLRDKYAEFEAEYSRVEAKEHKLRTRVFSAKEHIKQLQDEAPFEQDGRTRATLNQVQKIVDKVEQDLSSYATSKKYRPGHLLGVYESAMKLCDLLFKTNGLPRPPKRSGAAILSEDTDLSDSGSGSDWPSDSDETSDDEDGYETCDCGDRIDSDDDRIQIHHHPSIWTD